MPKIKLQCPKDAHGASVGGVSYTPDAQGVIEVENEHAAPLIGLGFAPVVEDAPAESANANDDPTPPADAPATAPVVEDAANKNTKAKK